jgi:hypothetical protein
MNTMKFTGIIQLKHDDLTIFANMWKMSINVDDIHEDLLNDLCEKCYQVREIDGGFIVARFATDGANYKDFTIKRLTNDELDENCDISLNLYQITIIGVFNYMRDFVEGILNRINGNKLIKLREFINKHEELNKIMYKMALGTAKNKLNEFK